jgi:hypothetical protein
MSSCVCVLSGKVWPSILGSEVAISSWDDRPKGQHTLSSEGGKSDMAQYVDESDQDDDGSADRESNRDPAACVLSLEFL